MKKPIFLLLVCLLSAAPFSEARTTEKPSTSATNDATPLLTKRITLKQISNREALTLRGIEGSDAFTFGGQSDELITRAVLHLRYTYSPALIPGESHLKILVNDEVVHVLPVTKENVGRNITQDLEIDPRLFTNLTRIKFQFIGHYTHDCEEPFHSSLWMEISGFSQFELTVRPLALNNDLALLPEPFFNAHEFSNKLTVPFVFSSAPGKDTLNAAGIVSSWFGKLAAWRGARFPAKLDTLAAGHAVVFASNEDRPAFLKDYPKITGPMLEMMTNPADGRSKLLLILGRNGADQKIAAQALVLGNAALAGSRASIRDVKQESLRKPYDAPAWVRMDRPMKFGELVAWPQELQVAGYAPQPIRIPLRVPPDLFTWRSRGVPIDLKYRYTPPLHLSESRLRMGVNGELVKSFTLLPSGEVEKNRIRLPLIDDMVFGQSQELMLPSFKLGTRNELQFQFTTAPQKEGLCRDYINENVRDMIDADSKIDFSGFPHYAEMPNLNYFATAGFPFTKYADLSQTIVVLPEHPTAYDIETMLTLLGRMGESTGYPATQFGIAHASEGSRLKDADLLVIGAALKQGLLTQWGDKLPVDIRDGMLRNSQPKRSVSFLFDWLNFDTQPDPDILAQQQLSENGSLAAMLGFESPLSSQRSVVAVVSTQPESLTQTLDALERSSNDIHGSAAFIHPNKVESFLVGQTYTIGELPFLTSIWYPFANHPVLLAILAALAVLVFAFALWRTLRVIAAKRLRNED
ncbi:cellulose synthase regulator [Ferrigenium kumadai]|uniref:Cyclic di-GMP-binding protein n=1 Tax=Ferrigenium kumadai TaxID=1682490 RepID=A0AAN1W0Q0_9PROT|nr:cellulose biosynthesis cyclic di-GMP-binding regulatory protein BcsB [Ferrigenium kumadai]BBI99542.1 cellulose synthase regulator [Ferrigenium kumadai]